MADQFDEHQIKYDANRGYIAPNGQDVFPTSGGGFSDSIGNTIVKDKWENNVSTNTTSTPPYLGDGIDGGKLKSILKRVFVFSLILASGIFAYKMIDEFLTFQKQKSDAFNRLSLLVGNERAAKIQDAENMWVWRKNRLPTLLNYKKIPHINTAYSSKYAKTFDMPQKVSMMVQALRANPNDIEAQIAATECLSHDFCSSHAFDNKSGKIKFNQNAAPILLKGVLDFEKTAIKLEGYANVCENFTMIHRYRAATGYPGFSYDDAVARAIKCMETTNDKADLSAMKAIQEKLAK